MDFLRLFRSYSGIIENVSTSGGLWFSILMVLLFGALSYARTKSPSASRFSENLVLAIATVAFFAICEVFLRH
jgi:hypothetical protein